mgnify:CR=1 FL=1
MALTFIVFICPPIYWKLAYFVFQVTFNKDEVVVPDIPGMFTSFQVKGLPLFVDPRLFGEPLHYAKIMGYDKPIDFKLKDSADNSSTEGKKKAA